MRRRPVLSATGAGAPPRAAATERSTSSTRASATWSRRLLPGVAAAIIVMAACGGGGAADGDGDRQVEDVVGTVNLPERPERIVADAVSTYANLAALGVTPVGVAIPLGISPEYIGGDTDAVTNVVADDGWTVNLEAALALEPEMILAVGADYNLENCERYKAALPTYCFEDLWGGVPEILEVVRNIGTAIGREDEAEAAIADFEAEAADLRERITAAGLTDIPVGVVRFDSGGFIGIRPDEPIIAYLGLTEPEWPPLSDSGYVELSMETLDVLNAAEILLVTTDDDVVIEDMEVFTSPFWETLEPVASGNAHFVGAWNGADLPQYNRMLEDIARTVVEPAEG